MDPFTQRMLEKAEQRSKTLGVSKATKFPLSECDAVLNSNSEGTIPHTSKQNVKNESSLNKFQVIEKTASKDETNTSQSSSSLSDKVMRQFSAVDKENMDMGIQINITTASDVKVHVEVEEQDITDDSEIDHQQNEKAKPIAKIRDTSRNRLQRLGDLYSNTADLSSPIHRTEGKFHEDPNEDAIELIPKKSKPRYNKLAVLANTINQWEDDICHTSTSTHSSLEVSQQTLISSDSSNTTKPIAEKSIKVVDYKLKENNSNQLAKGTEIKTKQLKWDPKVLNSLEAQGFQRRESTNTKIAYDYGKDKEISHNQSQPITTNSHQKNFETTKVKDIYEKFNKKADVTPAALGEKKPLNTGLVSGRTAIFENKSNTSQPPIRPQKDPTELSLKERMQLFERNKGEALVPKAPFGMAPPISKILQDGTAKKYDDAQTKTSAKETSSSAALKANKDVKVRDKVAALVSHPTTISENKIKEEISKQRNEDMRVIANRFNKQKELVEVTKDKPATPPAPPSVVCTFEKKYPNTQNAGTSTLFTPHAPPPPPPPPPLSQRQSMEVSFSKNKRRSPGNCVDDIKRPRNHLYPELSDLESNNSYSDNGNCTTATMSGRNTVDEEADDHVIKPLVNRRCSKDDINSDDGCCNESYMESEDSSTEICNGSLGREIMQVVKTNEKQKNIDKQQPQKQRKGVHYADRDFYYGDSSVNSSDASAGINDYLDEALDENEDDDNADSESTQESDDDNNSRVSLTSKGTTTSNSFSFKKTPKKYISCHTISEENDNSENTPNVYLPPSSSSSMASPVTSALTVNQEDNNMVTLVHTVSFYRRQQNTNSNNSTPIRVINREQVSRSTSNDGYNQKQEYHEGGSVSESEDSGASNEIEQNRLVQEKIKKLLDEVCKQQQVIGQTSQALNLCASTIEFSGSTESVEGERHLLVATHRRQAALDEVQRLRVENTLRPIGSSEAKERGQLTVRDITVPLRQDYIRKLAADTITGHHLVCLLKYNELVLATRTVPTLPGLVAVRFPDVLQLNNVYADFRVTLEIYGMTAQREVLPHELKYHININNKKSGPKTPKKKGNDSRLIMPMVQSPAGPNAVRTPALVQYAFAIFSLREIQRTTWTLTQVLGVSPLDGVVHMKVNCELSVSLQHKGFLTMFEDTAGCAWHRRWCYLQGHVLNYWKYPDDEKKKAPMGSIDLYTCVTKKVAVAPRDICARLNTILLETERPALDNDKESYLIKPNGKMTIVRHLLSADTKEERDEWCAFFNKALTLLRAWGRPQ